jgi:hypothetical protein
MKIYLLNIFTYICSILIVNAYKCNFSINLNESKLIRFERDPFECRVFHICAFNRTYTLSCVKGYYFDSVKNICNFENLVDCHVIEPTVSTVVEKFAGNNESNSSSTENLRVGEISSIVFESMEDDDADDSIEVAAEYDDDDGNDREEDGEEEIDYDNEKKTTISIIPSTIANKTTETITTTTTTATTTTTTTKTTTVSITSTTTSSPITLASLSDKMNTTTIEPVVIIQNFTTVPIIIPNRLNNSSKFISFIH